MGWSSIDWGFPGWADIGRGRWADLIDSDDEDSGDQTGKPENLYVSR